MHIGHKIFMFLSLFLTKELVASTWTDRNTYLMWELKSEYNIMYEYDWTGANQYCDSLHLDGYDDWWLPSTIQLRTLSNIRLYGEYNDNWDSWFLRNETYKNNGYFIKDAVQYNVGTEGDYWSLSDYASSARSEEEEAWFVDFEAGYDDWTYTSSQHYVRCVRSSY